MHVEGKAISFEKYKEICKENIYGWENETMAFDFPWDFAIIKVRLMIFYFQCLIYSW